MSMVLRAVLSSSFIKSSEKLFLSPTKSLRGSQPLSDGMNASGLQNSVFPQGVNEPEPLIQWFVSKWCPGGSRDRWRFRGPKSKG